MTATAIASPILYVGGIKTDVAVQGNRIGTLETEFNSLNAELGQTQEDAAASKAYFEAVLPSRFGINPKSVWNNGTTTNQ